MAVNPAFLGHGIWLELAPINGLKRYAKFKPLPPNPPIAKLVENFIAAITAMKMYRGDHRHENVERLAGALHAQRNDRQGRHQGHARAGRRP
jgi:hypothetical protein